MDTTVNAGRWHELRIKAVEPFWSAVDNVCFRMAVYFPDTHHVDLEAKARRPAPTQ